MTVHDPVLYLRLERRRRDELIEQARAQELARSVSRLTAAVRRPRRRRRRVAAVVVVPDLS